MINFKQIGNRLKIIREYFQLTQTQLADKIGCPQGNYNRYENGERKIPDEIKLILADTFSININWLLTGNGEMLQKYSPEHQNKDFSQALTLFKKLAALDEKDLQIIDLLLEKNITKNQKNELIKVLSITLKAMKQTANVTIDYNLLDEQDSQS